MKKLVKIVKNFITDEEVKVLNQWTLDHYKNPYFMDPKMNKDDKQTRFTTRHAYGRCKEYQDYKVEYPKEVYDIQKRLFDYLKVKENTIAPWPSFTDGICTTIAFSPGSCCKHTDPVYYENTYTLHCNFVTQNPEIGGITYVEDVPYQFKEKDMLMYITSHLDHEVTKISGDNPRILWVYGFCILKEELEVIFNHKKINYSYC
tara:strand:- start:874 stop:1482 length:609 start_codon:yes stop_codon:yes gene_type:complete